MAHLGADAEDLLQRAFAHQVVHIRFFRHHHRHAAAFKIKRDLIDFLPTGRKLAGRLLIHAFQYRRIQQILQPGLVMAVQPRGMQNVLAGFSRDISMILQHNFILRQGPGFIGAQDIHRAKVLDGIKVLDDDFLFRQLHRPARQRRGDDHRQHFWGQPYRNRQRKQRRLPPIAFGIAVNDEHNGRHHQHKADQQHADAADPFLEGILLAFLLADAARQLPEPGIGSGRNHNSLRRAAHHIGPHKAQRIALQRVALLRVAAGCDFLHGQRFPGQRSLRHKQIARLDDT